MNLLTQKGRKDGRKEERKDGRKEKKKENIKSTNFFLEKKCKVKLEV